MDDEFFKRDHYVSQLLVGATLNSILVVTGLRRVGKSTLLNDLFLPRCQAELRIPDDHLIKENVSTWEQKDRTVPYLREMVERRIRDGGKHLLILDEVQMIDGNYPEYLRSLALKKNVLICLTGSNSHGLSTDIADSFGDAAFPIHLFPLNYREILAIRPEYPFDLYYGYGGLPAMIKLPEEADDARKNYLDDVLDKTYVRDIYSHDQSLEKLGEDKIKGVLRHFAENLTTEISLKKTIREIFGDFEKSRKSFLTQEEKLNLGIAFNNLVPDYEKSYLVHVFEESRRDLANDEPSSYKEQKKLYIADQGLLHQLSLGSGKLNANLLENLVYLELRRAGYRPTGLDLAFEKGGELRNGRVDFLFQNDHGTNFYIQTVHSFSDMNMDREIDPLLALPDGEKLVIFRENNLFAKEAPENVKVIGIEEFCRNVDRFCPN